MEYVKEISPTVAEVAEVAELGSDRDSEKQEQRKHRRLASWRISIVAGALVTTITFLTNVGLLAYAIHSRHGGGDTVVVYEGDAKTMRRITLWAHLPINILSTLLLAASNYCAQLLSSPTRQELDKAHSKNVWLDIGVLSLRNFRHIGRGRLLISLLLFASSLPIHMFYNSVIYNTLAVNKYQGAIVTDGFLHGGWWNKTKHLTDNGLDIFGFKNFTDEEVAPTTCLVKLSNTECLENYYVTEYQEEWGNVLIVTSVDRNDSVIDIFNVFPAAGVSWATDPFGECDVIGVEATEYDCIPDTGSVDPENWTIWTTQCGSEQNYTVSPFITKSCAAPVQYCLAEPTRPKSTISISIPVLSIVIVCNLLKLACLIATVFLPDFSPLATTEDAIASFLKTPDVSIPPLGPLSAQQLRDKEFRARVFGGKIAHMKFLRKSYRWINALSLRRRLICFLTPSMFWFAGFTCLFAGFVIKFHGFPAFYPIESIHAMWTQGFGSMNGEFVAGKRWHTSLTANILIANSPQLAASVAYICYYSALSSMISARDFARFADMRSPLRVSKPEGQQHTKYWLRLPYQYVIPLTISMAMLHWIVSRSFFLYEFVVYNGNGKTVFDQPVTYEMSGSTSENGVSACGYSPIAIVFGIFLGGFMILVLAGLSCRKLTSGIPIVASNSLAISAAVTHAGTDEPGAELVPLMYGVLQEPVGGLRVPRVGLSSKEVKPLVDGVVYG